jgi:hypothetical protein
MPPPFTEPSTRGGKILIPPGLIPPDLSQEQMLPKILEQPRQFMAGQSECAIPLAQAAVSKDRQFLIRRLPGSMGSKADPMSAHMMPVCRE